MTKHSHYHKDVSNLKTIDAYRMLELFGVTDQALGHAIKKLLCAGQRGAGKTFEQDVREAVDTLNRRLQMLAEDDTPKDFGVGLPEGWNSFKDPHRPWAIGERLDFLLITGVIQNSVSYQAGMGLTNAVAWRFSETPTPSLPKQYEHEATHRDGGGSKYKQDGRGRWMQWGNDSWFTFSSDPKAVPPGLQALPVYDGHD